MIDVIPAGRRANAASPHRVLRWAFVMAALILLGTSCTFWRTSDGWTTEPEGRTVAVVGDSITSSAADELYASVPDDTAVHVRARPLQTWDDLALDLALVAALEPDVTIINVGTNDGILLHAIGLSEAETVAHLQARADAALSSFVGCAVLVIPTANPWGSDDGPFVPAYVGTHVTADWRSAAQPEWLEDPIGHLTPAGQAAYADWVWTQGCE